MAEEVDIFYARHNSLKLNSKVGSIRDVILESVEALENMREGTNQYKQAIFNMYLLAMGKYEIEGLNQVTVRERRKYACEEINKVTSVSIICHNLNSKLSQLPEMASLEEPEVEAQILLEQELRMLLNILINIMLNIEGDEQLIRDFLDPSNLIEQMCFKSIKLSLEMAVVPIRKFLIIFYLILRFLFGSAPGKTILINNLNVENSSNEWKDMKYQKDLLIALVEKDEPARFNFKQSESNPVELFYKRHMSSDNPIPQIIVVGILRVLLTTCPNAVRNSGGIDLHHEWSACFEFLFHHK